MKIKDTICKIPLLRLFLFRILFKQRKENDDAYIPVKIGEGDIVYKKNIYVIRWKTPIAGLFAYVLAIISEIAWAERMNYVPVVDMQTFKNTYLEESDIGKVNAWNHYFENVSELTLEDCTQYSNVYTGNGSMLLLTPLPSVGWMKDRKQILYWQSIAKKYVKLNAKTKEYCENECEVVLKGNHRVLGVKARGTDYNPISAKRHPIQPSVKCMIQKAEEVMHQYRCDYIFLATEDKDIKAQFEDAFKDKLLLSSSTLVDYDTSAQGWVSTYSTGRENDKYLQGLEYLCDEYILSKCTCLIGGINGGTAGALILGDSFEYTYFWYLGRY